VYIAVISYTLVAIIRQRLRTDIPEFIFITEGSVHDVNAMDYISIEKGSYYIMDKAYIDFARLYNIMQEKAYFVGRAKENIKFKRLSPRPVDKSLGILHWQRNP
jgi:transposase